MTGRYILKAGVNRWCLFTLWFLWLTTCSRAEYISRQYEPVGISSATLKRNALCVSISLLLSKQAVEDLNGGEMIIHLPTLPSTFDNRKGAQSWITKISRMSTTNDVYLRPSNFSWAYIS